MLYELYDGKGREADDAFHAILTEAADNEALNAILDMCAGLLSRTRPITQALRGVPKQTLKDHTAIVEAVAARDERAARRTRRRHLERAMRNLNRIKDGE